MSVHARFVIRSLAVAAVLVLGGCGGENRTSSPGGETAVDPPAGRGGAAPRLETSWTWPAPPPSSAGMPAADGEGVAVTSGHRRLVLLDPTGGVRWQVERLGLRDVAPALTADLVLSATDDGLVAYDRATGQRRWEATLGERANTPVVAAGRAVVTTWEGSLAGVDLVTGQTVWKVELGGDAMGPAAASGATVVATFDAGRTPGPSGRSGGAMAVDAATGRRVWAVPLPAGGVSAPAIQASTAPPGRSRAGTVVVVAGDAAVHGLALDDGAERWRLPVEGAGSPEVPPLALGDGTVLVAHRLGGLVLVDPGRGESRWEVSSDTAAVRGGPAGPGPGGWFALPLHDGRLLLAGPDRATEVLELPALVTGVAAGPRQFLVVASGQGEGNGVTASTGW